MSKWLKVIIVIIIALGIIGYGVFHFGTKMASEKLMEAVSSELQASGQIEQVKTYIEKDPQLRQFIEEAEAADESQLPFTTKEEAVKVIMEKVGVSGLQDMVLSYQEGNISKEDILLTLQTNLTEEEITALKVIAYKELYQ